MILFLFAYFHYGAVLEPDSASYIKMTLGREPLYPLFLWLGREIFGVNYLDVIAAVQCVFGALTVWYVGHKFKRMLHYGVKMGIIVDLLLMTPYFMTEIVARLLGLPGEVYPCEIISEGLSIPLFELFFCQLMLAVQGGAAKWYLTRAAVLAIILSACRSQMLVTVLLVLLAGFYIAFKEKSSWLYPMVLAALSFMLVSLVMHCYFLWIYGRFISNTTGPLTYSASILFVSEEEDVNLFHDEEIRELYRKVLLKMDEGRYREKYASKGIMKVAKYAEETHDGIVYYVLMPELRKYVMEKGIADEVDVQLAMDEIAAQFAEKSFPQNVGKWLMVYIGYVIFGLARSIAINRSLFYGYVFVCYLLAGILTVRAFLRNRNSGTALLMTFSLLTIVGNVTAVSMVIMPISRYMIYAFPFFYIAGLLLLREEFYVWKSSKQ